MLTNFSRVGEVANMTVTEVKEGKEVAPGYFSVEVAKHKTASSMGKAPVMLLAQDLTLLRQYIKSCRRGCPDAEPPEQNCQHRPWWIGRSASRIRKSLAGWYMYDDTKFKKALSAKMQHTEATHSQWYEGKARRKEMLTVVRRINEDFSKKRTPSATVTSATVANAEGVQVALEAPAPSTMDTPSSTLTTMKATSSAPKQGSWLASLLQGKPFQRASSSREGPQATVTPQDVEVPTPDSLQSPPDSLQSDSSQLPLDSPHSPLQQFCTPMHHDGNQDCIFVKLCSLTLSHMLTLS